MMTHFDHSERAPLAPDQSTRKGVLLVATMAAIAFLLICGPRWGDGDWRHETIEWTGLGLIILCILGRTWCSLYIGGRKNSALITNGPYSVCRHPLYVFSIIGAVGVGAQVGSIIIALTCGFIAWAIFLWTAMKEEAALLANFSADYREYFKRVPRFLPKPSLWRDSATIEVRPQVVMLTFVDALVFLIAVPIAEGIDYLHTVGVLPLFIILP